MTPALEIAVHVPRQCGQYARGPSLRLEQYPGEGGRWKTGGLGEGGWWYRLVPLLPEKFSARLERGGDCGDPPNSSRRLSGTAAEDDDDGDTMRPPSLRQDS